MRRGFFRRCRNIAMCVVLGAALCGCGGNGLSKQEKLAVEPVVDALNRQTGNFTLLDDVLIVYGTNEQKEEKIYVFVEHNGEETNGHAGGSVAMYFETTYLGEYTGDAQSKLDLKAFANSGFSDEYTRTRVAADCYTAYLQGNLSSRDSFLNQSLLVEKEKVAEYIEQKYGRTVQVKE
ncbi:MAG: hypothetical protein IJ747_09020 [Lachnospiraceae bacterium]|nr:hypothetical protein [Lachnospiraceae bacterium]